MSAASGSAIPTHSVTHSVTQVTVNPSPKAVQPSHARADSSAGNVSTVPVNNPVTDTLVNFEKMRNAGMEQTSIHIMTECPGHWWARMQFLGALTLYPKIKTRFPWKKLSDLPRMKGTGRI